MTPRAGVLLIRKSSRGNGGWVAWSLLGGWLAAVVLVVPAGAEEFSLTRCLAAGFGRIDPTRYFACYEAQREAEVSRYKEAAERESQRRATEEATRQQEAEAQAQAQAQEAADRAAKARQEAERARKAEEVERARRAEAVERTRKAAEGVDAARLQEAQRRRAAEQFMPGMCPLGDLTAKCAMSSPDPVVEQIRRSQENAARGRPSR